MKERSVGKLGPGTRPPKTTQGPWVVGKLGRIIAEVGITGPDGFVVAEAHGDDDMIATGERDANAKMIAASPAVIAAAFELAQTITFRIDDPRLAILDQLWKSLADAGCERPKPGATTHTPGPWVVVMDSSSPHGVAIRQDNATYHDPALIADVRVIGLGLRGSAGLANAYIMAASLDLLTASKRLIAGAEERGETRDEVSGEEHEEWKQLRLAIERAEPASIE